MSKATISQPSIMSIPLPQSPLATGHSPLATAFLIATRPRIEIGVTHSFKRRKHFLIATRMRCFHSTELTDQIARPAKINRRYSSLTTLQGSGILATYSKQRRKHFLPYGKQQSSHFSHFLFQFFTPESFSRRFSPRLVRQT